MLLGVFGVGPVELLVVAVVALLMVAVPIAVVVAVVIIARRASVAGLAGRFPPPAGAPRVVRTFGPVDEPISHDARWIGNELEVKAEQAGPQRLFELPLGGIEQSMLSYRFRIRTEALKSHVYPEMWCRVVGMAEAFSRGLNQKIRGDNNWLSLEAPFYLGKGQFAELLKLNLVFEGPGIVRLTDIEVLATPLEPAASSSLKAR